MAGPPQRRMSDHAAGHLRTQPRRHAAQRCAAGLAAARCGSGTGSGAAAGAGVSRRCGAGRSGAAVSPRWKPRLAQPSRGTATPHAAVRSLRRPHRTRRDAPAGRCRRRRMVPPAVAPPGRARAPRSTSSPSTSSAMPRRCGCAPASRGAAADAVARIASWRRIPAPLAWMCEARWLLDGLDTCWGLLAELAWLAPARFDALLQRRADPLLQRLRRQFDQGFEGSGDITRPGLVPGLGADRQAGAGAAARPGAAGPADRARARHAACCSTCCTWSARAASANWSSSAAGCAICIRRCLRPTWPAAEDGAKTLPAAGARCKHLPHGPTTRLPAAQPTPRRRRAAAILPRPTFSPREYC